MAGDRRSGYLVDRLDNLWRGLGQVIVQLMNTGEWSLLGPAFLVCAVTMLVVGRERIVAAFYLLAGVPRLPQRRVRLLGHAVRGHRRVRAALGARIVLGVVFVGAVGLAHLLQIAASTWTAPEHETAPAQSRGAEPVPSIVEAGGIRSAP